MAPATLVNPDRNELMPVAIDRLAREDPNRPWASVPYDDDDLSKGYEDIPYKVLANSVNRLAWIIDSCVPKSKTIDTIAYLGGSDLRYHMMQMAAAKTGRVVLFSSHLNSLSVHLTLMEKLDCKALLYSTGQQVDDILGERPMPNTVVPELDELLSLDVVAEWYPYNRTLEEAIHDPYTYIHTSGTTGTPKPVSVSHGMLWSFLRQEYLPDVEGRTHVLDFVLPGKGTRVILPVAPYHGISSLTGLLMSVLGGGIFVMPLRHRGMSVTDPIPDILFYSKAQNGFLVPHVMETTAKMPDPEKYIKNFKSVSFGGGEISEFAGKIWSKYTKIQNAWGATEAGFPPQLRPDPGDHAYVYFDMKHSGIEFREVKLDDYTDGEGAAKVYEMVLTWTPECAPYSAYYDRQDPRNPRKGGPPYPDHPIGDLWTPHPDPAKARFAWRFAGRIDDVICLDTGINVNTGNIEKALMGHKLVKAALVIGNKRMQPLALVELVPGTPASAAQEIWKSVLVPLNANMQSQARIASTHMLVVPESGLVRTVKGTISKTKSERKFEKEIDAIYAKFGDKYQDHGRDKS